MAKVGGKKVIARSPHTKKQREVLKALEAAAKRMGLRVSAGKLRFAGLKLKGGCCLLRGHRWLVVDREQPFDDQVDIFRQALSTEDLTTSDLSDELRLMVAPYLGLRPGYSSGQSA